MWITNQVHCNYKWLKWFKTLERISYEREHLVDKEAEKRVKILLFLEKHKLEATLDAFDVSERTLYNWKKKYKDGKKTVYSLSNKSRRPNKTRKREWHYKVLEKIIKYREDVPNIWKEKIYPMLSIYCDLNNYECPWISTIWRLIKDLWWLRQYNKKTKLKWKQRTRNKVLRKPSQLPARLPWEVVALDSVEIRWEWATKRYVITIIDIYSRFSHAIVSNSHSSKTAMSAFLEFQNKFPFKIKSVLTDNGSEFMLHFKEYLDKENIIHYHTYPRNPKMNAHSERFNRTIREWVLNINRYKLTDLAYANDIVKKFLHFYNTKRVHYAFSNKLTPLQKLCLYDNIDINKITAI